MTARDGFPRDMDPFALDALTAERLVTGAVDVGDAPPEYRAVARVLHALRSAPDTVESAGEPAAVERIAGAVVVRRRPRRTRRAQRARRSSSRAVRLAAAAAVAAAVCVTGGFASAGSLPEPAQTAASTVLGTVGISVPTGGEKPAGVEEPATTTETPTPAATNPNAPAEDAPSPTTSVSPTPSSPAAPGNGNGTPAHGTPPSTAKEHGKDHSPNDSPPDGVGNGKGR
jgi:hypothetical protein